MKTKMNFAEALPLLREGNPLRRSTWKPKRHIIYRASTENLKVISPNDELNTWLPTVQDLFADDWDSYEHHVLFEEALAALRKGKRVRRTSWSAGQCLYLRPADKDRTYHHNYLLSLEDVLAEDWVVLE